MFSKQIDFLSLGDMATDAFIRLKNANVHCKVNTNDCEICMPFGDKIPFEYVKVVKAVGNSANAAVSAARLGLRTAFVTNIGEDQNGRDCVVELEKNKVITSYVKRHKNKSTNYHFVLWYDVDRTILVNHTEFDYHLPHFPAPKWIYLSSLASNSYPYHMEIADYLDKNPSVKLAFQPGTFQMNLGLTELKRIYERTEVFVVNVEEAQRILKTDSRDPKNLMKQLSVYGPKLVVITDNTNGAYLYDHDHYYQMPMYPDPRPAFERTGCGDAWASTFVSALIMGKTPLEALMWAPVNPMSVAQFVGAQEGLLSREQIEWWLKRAPEDYKPREI
ncbi:MAG: carbohydrate kinase family protein [Candidatus Paceibacterota bacterium]|jgi:sugar/nucleoside kinase (ribokinase family)